MERTHCKSAANLGRTYLLDRSESRIHLAKCNLIQKSLIARLCCSIVEPHFFLTVARRSTFGTVHLVHRESLLDKSSGQSGLIRVENSLTKCNLITKSLIAHVVCSIVESFGTVSKCNSVVTVCWIIQVQANVGNFCDD